MRHLIIATFASLAIAGPAFAQAGSGTTGGATSLPTNQTAPSGPNSTGSRSPSGPTTTSGGVTDTGVGPANSGGLATSIPTAVENQAPAGPNR